jgi:hypothetical protein
LSVSITERSEAGTVYDRLKIGIAGSNSASGMDVCPHVSVLCCPVSVEALRWADPPVKRPTRRWEDNIRMDLREIVRDFVVNRIHLARGKV